MGPMAAMALPPQIAVPAVIRNDELPRTRNNLPNTKPRKSAKEIPSAVWINPLRPAFRTSCRFMPKPRATTELCRRVRAIPRLSLMIGCEKLRPKRIPRVSAIGGENNPVTERTRPRAKKIFARVGIDWEKNICPEADQASVPQFDCARPTPLAILPPENVEILQRTSSVGLRWRELAALGRQKEYEWLPIQEASPKWEGMPKGQAVAEERRARTWRARNARGRR